MAVFLPILLAFIAPVVVSATCYNPGPSFPPVHLLLNQSRLEPLRATLNNLISDILKAPEAWPTNTTSFALQVTSANETLWDYYYTAPILGDYKDSEPTRVSGDTAFRIASVSKTFTVYAALLEGKINLDDPITKYVPELTDPPPYIFSVDWHHVTIRSLASQLSGISRDGKPLLDSIQGSANKGGF
jgi:CubicO group peptidase (beta-lactamase class C family)